MDFHFLSNIMTEQNMLELIERYKAFGPIPGILFPMIEAFLPFLPLFVFVIANTNAFGLWFGFLLTWVGSTLGAIFVFLIIRKFGHTKVLAFIKRNKQVKKLTSWLDVHGFAPIFLLLCFPFTPSAVVNIVAGLSEISKIQYILAVATGKLVMIFMISFIGHDIMSLVENPGKTAVVLILIFVLWYVGKRVEARLNKGMHQLAEGVEREKARKQRERG
ncbi:MAG: TVP38/TMEM64 family protein [Bacillus sp. (in: firmicutes)]